MTAPQWSPVDDHTADLLALVSDEGHVSTDHEWETFCAAILAVSVPHGWVRPNAMRELLRGKVAPRRIGAFYRRACLEGLLSATGDYEVSDDREGRNIGRPARVYRLGTA